MKKSKSNIYRCTCCKVETYQSGLSKSLDLLKSYYKNTLSSYYHSMKSEIVFSFHTEGLVWACDTCFRKGKVIPSIPEKIYNGGEPHLVYFDTKINCSRCNEDFIFSKKEKKFWYEGLMFYIDSVPKNCLNCRSIVRKERKDHSRLSELLSRKNELTKGELEEVSSIYERMEKEEKMKMYQTFARKIK